MKKLIACLCALVLSLSFAQAAVQYGYMNQDTDLRISPSADAIFLVTLSAGDQVSLSAQTTDASGALWYEVTHGASALKGYVPADTVDFVQAKKAPGAFDETPRGMKKLSGEDDYSVLDALGLMMPASCISDEEYDAYLIMAENPSKSDTQKITRMLSGLSYYSTEKQKKAGLNAALAEFQRMNSLPETGEYDVDTLACLFSDTARAADGTYPMLKTVWISSGSVSSKGGTSISYHLNNATDTAVDAFTFRVSMYNTYGEQYFFAETAVDHVTKMQQSEERYTIKANSYRKITLNVTDMMYITGFRMAVTSYHTTTGQTVRIPDDQLLWCAFGKGQTAGVEALVASPLTDAEKESAKAWSLGVSGAMIDAETAKKFSLREGYYIQEVSSGSAAEDAGLQVGDVLLAAGPYRIYGETTVRRVEANMMNGEIFDLIFLRGGQLYLTSIRKPGDISL